jgi:hypothetical protein
MGLLREEISEMFGWTAVQSGIARVLRKPEPGPVVLDKVDDLKAGDIVMVVLADEVVYYEISSNDVGWITTEQDYCYSHGFLNRAIERGEAVVTLLPPSLGRLLQSSCGDVVDLGDFRQYS